MSHAREDRITKLRDAVLNLADQTESRVETALEAWLNQDADLADSIRFADDEIDQMENDLQTDCLEILAGDHPQSDDLRFVVASMRIVGCFERMADLARSIAKRVQRLDRSKDHVPFPPDARPMAQAVREMVAMLGRALASMETSLAQQVRTMDETVDQHNRDVFRWAVTETGKFPQQAESYFNTIVLVRALERIGDLATNIAEDIIFVAESKVVRHTTV